MEKVVNIDELLEAVTHTQCALFGFKKSACLKCAVELGIPEVIGKHGKPFTLSELISALPIHPSKSDHIHRLMQFLANSDFFVEKPDQGYALTPAGRLLLKDEPFNVRAYVFMAADPVVLKPWFFLTEWYQNDDLSPFYTAHGNNLWHYAAREVPFGQMFNEVMANDSEFCIEVLMTKCKFVFEGLATLADVGGGTGKFARAIAKNFPSIKSTVYDLPLVVANEGGDKNVDFVAGDMFESVPYANAILLKLILHDCSDEDCTKILKNCRKAIAEKHDGGKVIIIDIVMGSQIQDKASLQTQINTDMQMLVALGPAKERTEKEWAKLFMEAGFTSYKVYPILGTVRSLIEVYP